MNRSSYCSSIGGRCGWTGECCGKSLVLAALLNLERLPWSRGSECRVLLGWWCHMHYLPLGLHSTVSRRRKYKRRIRPASGPSEARENKGRRPTQQVGGPGGAKGVSLPPDLQVPLTCPQPRPHRPSGPVSSEPQEVGRDRCH